MSGADGLLRIGDFSRLSELSLRVLRHYDQLGLLVPTRVDPVTGYRWYAPSQLADAHRIVALKELGLGLAQVAAVLGGEPSDDEIAGMLRLERSRSAATREEAELRIRRIDRQLEELRRHGRLDDLPVVVRVAGCQPVLSRRARFADLDDLSDVVQRLLGAPAVTELGEVVVIGHDELVSDGPLDAEVAVITGAPGPLVVDDDLVLEAGQLAAVPALAVVVVSGDLEVEHGRALRSLGRWLAATGHRLDGPVREVLHPAPGTRDELTVEIQHPVAPADELTGPSGGRRPPPSANDGCRLRD